MGTWGKCIYHIHLQDKRLVKPRAGRILYMHHQQKHTHTANVSPRIGFRNDRFPPWSRGTFSASSAISKGGLSGGAEVDQTKKTNLQVDAP